MRGLFWGGSSSLRNETELLSGLRCDGYNSLSPFSELSMIASELQMFHCSAAFVEMLWGGRERSGILEAGGFFSFGNGGRAKLLVSAWTIEGILLPPHNSVLGGGSVILSLRYTVLQLWGLHARRLILWPGINSLASVSEYQTAGGQREAIIVISHTSTQVVCRKKTVHYNSGHEFH